METLLEFIVKNKLRNNAYALPYVVVFVYDGDNDNYESIIRRSKNIFDETTCFENPEFEALPGWVINVKSIPALIKNLKVSQDNINNSNSKSADISIDIFKIPEVFAKYAAYCSASKMADYFNAALDNTIKINSNIQQEFNEQWKHKEYYTNY